MKITFTDFNPIPPIAIERHYAQSPVGLQALWGCWYLSYSSKAY